MASWSCWLILRIACATVTVTLVFNPGNNGISKLPLSTSLSMSKWWCPEPTRSFCRKTTTTPTSHLQKVSTRATKPACQTLFSHESASELQEYCDVIGLNPEEDPDLMWIAKEGLKAPLPQDWKPVWVCPGPCCVTSCSFVRNGVSVVRTTFLETFITLTSVAEKVHGITLVMSITRVCCKRKRRRKEDELAVWWRNKSNRWLKQCYLLRCHHWYVAQMISY